MRRFLNRSHRRGAVTSCTSPTADTATTRWPQRWCSRAVGIGGHGERMAAVFGTLVNNGTTRRARLRHPHRRQPTPRYEVAGEAGAKTMRPQGRWNRVAGRRQPPTVPGGDHLMLMGLTAPLSAGSDIELTVQFEDGSTLPVTVQVRDFAGANEEYQPQAQRPWLRSTGGASSPGRRRAGRRCRPHPVRCRSIRHPGP